MNNDMRDITKKIAAGAMAATLFCSGTAALLSSGAGVSAEDGVAVAETEMASQEGNIILPPERNNTTDEESDVDLQTALTKVKQRIDIPDGYDDFSYRRYENNGSVSYVFTWAVLETDVRNEIRVSITGNYITSYNKFSADDFDSKASFGKLSQKELTDKADKFINETNPALKGKYKLEFGGASLWGHYADFSAVRIENGIKLDNNRLSISLNKDTGEVTSMNVSWWGNASFASPAKKLTQQEASDAFKKNISYAPRYHLVYDYETDKYSAVLLYYPDDFDSLDALTGKKTTMYDDMKKAQDTSSYKSEEADAVAVTAEAAPAANAVSGGAKTVTFTKAEKDAMLKNKELISQDKAESIVKSDKYMGYTKNYMLESASLDRSGGSYVWELYYIIRNDDDYRSINACIDAKTGNVKSFSCYGTGIYDEKNNNFVEAKADVLAAEAYDYYLGKLGTEYKADEPGEDTVFMRGKSAAGKKYRYTRTVNGLPCSDDSVYINVGEGGTITRFNYSYTDVKFPSAERISESEAKDRLLSVNKPTLEYDGFSDMKGNAKTYLLYTLESSCIDAKTGDLCDYNGKPVTKENKDEKTEYTDIKGNFAESYIRKLYEYGITLECEDGKFNPSAAISESDFRSLINNITRPDEPVWIDLRNSANSDKIKYADFVTREDAAVILVTATGGEKIAKMNGIFKNDFKDITDDDENLGYIAVACGMNVMAKDNSDSFNPDVKITRARAMEMAYLYIAGLDA